MFTEEITDIRRELIGNIKETGREVKNEIEDNDKWGLIIKHGTYIIQLVHPKDLKFMVITFHLQFPDEVIKSLKAIIVDPQKGVEFEFGLTSAINSPSTGYKLHKNEDNIITGFVISKNIFPFHDGFTIADLDEAIQNIVSAGVLGLTFLQGILGVKKIEQEISEAIRTTPHEAMYG